MAMNGTVMGDAVVAAIQGVDGSLTMDQVTQLKSAWEAICGAIVAHIQANAVVTTAVAVASVSGVTTGISTSGPGTGTGTGTVA